jgi:hypothetical protein
MKPKDRVKRIKDMMPFASWILITYGKAEYNKFIKSFEIKIVGI